MFTNFIENIKTAEITNDEKLNILVLFFSIVYNTNFKNKLEKLQNLFEAINKTNLSTVDKIVLLKLLHNAIIKNI